MRITWCIMPLLLISLTNGAFSQHAEGDVHWWPFFSVAYWSADSDLNDYYKEILGFYRDNGIPIPTQTDFGKTLCINGGILMSRKSTIKIGVSFGYRYTPAYSSYADYAGTLKVNGSINSYEIVLVLKATMAEWWGFPVILSFEPGIGNMYATITEDLKYPGASQFNYVSKWTASGLGFQVRMMLGTSLRTGLFDVGLNAGYQASLNEANNVREHSVPMSLNQSGVVFLVSVGLDL